MDSLILVVNLGSASRKYALFAGESIKASINFEFEDGKVLAVVDYEGEKQKVHYDDTELSNVAKYVLPLLHQFKVLSESEVIDAVGIRVVAPSKMFTKDQLLTPDTERALEVLEQKAPLHITTVLAELKHLEEYFSGTPIVIISDSAFHTTKNELAWRYGIDTELADKHEILRYGYHGISISSVSRKMQEKGILEPKVIVCHLGSGSSLTALVDGKSFETTMGYTPLEGIMMATRSGNIDLSAALAIKRELNISDDELENYLNKKSGLSGVSGSSNDIRQLLSSEEQGDKRASLALGLFVYRIQSAIGQLAASMNGVDAIVFTATIGERSSIIRSRILDKLNYLGFNYDKELNDKTFEPKDAVNLAQSGSKPIYVLATDEATEIARHCSEFIANN